MGPVLRPLPVFEETEVRDRPNRAVKLIVQA